MRLFDLWQQQTMNFAARNNLRVSEFRCLNLLLRNNAIQMNQLAACMNKTSSRITRLIQPLIERGLVKRIEPENDRRLKIISLTDGGQQLAKEMKDQFEIENAQIMKEIGNGAPDQIIESISKLIYALERWNNKNKKITDHEFKNLCHKINDTK